MSLQEASFKAFLEQPENATHVEAYQRKEARKALRSGQRMSSINFRDKASTAAIVAHNEFKTLAVCLNLTFKSSVLLPTQHLHGAGVGVRL